MSLAGMLPSKALAVVKFVKCQQISYAGKCILCEKQELPPLLQ